MCDQLYLQDEFLKWIQDNQRQTHLHLGVEPLYGAHLTCVHSAQENGSVLGG